MDFVSQLIEIRSASFNFSQCTVTFVKQFKVMYQYAGAFYFQKLL